MNIGALAVVLGVTLLLADSYLTAGIRNAIVRPKIRLALGCAQCVSFWVGAGVSVALWRHGSAIFEWRALVSAPWAAIPLDAVACSGICGILGRLVSTGRPARAPVSIPREAE